MGWNPWYVHGIVFCVLISCVSEVVVKLAVKVAFTSETSQNLTTVKKERTSKTTNGTIPRVKI